MQYALGPWGLVLFRLHLYIRLHDADFDGTESEGKAKGVAQRAPLNDEPNKWNRVI